MFINKILSTVFINTLIIYIISKYIPWLGFHISFHQCSLEIYLIVWLIFWLIDALWKKIFKILTLPLNFLTLWVFGILVNIWFIYLFKYIVNTNIPQIATVELWTFVQVFIVSVVVYILNLLFKKL